MTIFPEAGMVLVIVNETVWLLRPNGAELEIISLTKVSVDASVSKNAIRLPLSKIIQQTLFRFSFMVKIEIN